MPHAPRAADRLRARDQPPREARVVGIVLPAPELVEQLAGQQPRVAPAGVLPDLLDVDVLDVVGVIVADKRPVHADAIGEEAPTLVQEAVEVVGLGQVFGAVFHRVRWLR